MYTLADFANFDKKNKYVLPLEVKQKLQQLCKNVGAEPLLVMVEEKKTIQDAIREINKLTEETKATRIPLILEIVNSVDIESFAQVLFTIISKNLFFSNVYTELFVQLQKKWPFFNELFECKYNEYLQSIDLIEIGDADQYDEYCEIKKRNDERRTFTLFMVNLVQCKAISMDHYTKTVDKVFTTIDSLLHVPKKEIMNELVEMLVILNIPGFPKEKVRQLSLLTPTNCVGINYKIIFRLMVILK